MKLESKNGFLNADKMKKRIIELTVPFSGDLNLLQHVVGYFSRSVTLLLLIYFGWSLQDTVLLWQELIYTLIINAVEVYIHILMISYIFRIKKYVIWIC